MKLFHFFILLTFFTAVRSGIQNLEKSIEESVKICCCDIFAWCAKISQQQLIFTINRITAVRMILKNR
jgi:hypothetical protein